MIAIHLAIVTLCNKQGSVPVKDYAKSAKEPDQVKPIRPIQENAQSTQPVAKAPQGKTVNEQVQSNGVKNGKMDPAQLENVKSVWPQLIERVKQTNPVASTFLRAVEPIGVDEGALRVMAHYALHRSFFEKPENRAPVEKILSELINTTITIRCFMAEAGPATAVDYQQKQRQQEEQLMKAVKEAFG
jgi:hypothetical protein